MRSQNCRRASGSKPVVGSSMKTSSGSTEDAQGDVDPPTLAAAEVDDAGGPLLLSPQTSITSSGSRGLA